MIKKKKYKKAIIKKRFSNKSYKTTVVLSYIKSTQSYKKKLLKWMCRFAEVKRIEKVCQKFHNLLLLRIINF